MISPNEIKKAIDDFAALPRAEQDAVLRAQRESWARSEARPYRSYPDDALIAERRKWDGRVASATSWGAGLGAATEARDDCDREIRLRNIEL